MTTLQDNSKLFISLYNITILLKKFDLKYFSNVYADFKFIDKNITKFKNIYISIEEKQNIDISGNDERRCYYCNGYIFMIYYYTIEIYYVCEHEYVLYCLFGIDLIDMDVFRFFDDYNKIHNIYKDHNTLTIKCKSFKIIAILINFNSNFLNLILSSKRKYINNLPIELYNYIGEVFFNY